MNLPFDNFESGNNNFPLVETLKRHHHRRGGGTKEPFSGFHLKRVATILHFFLCFFFYNLVGGKSLPLPALRRKGQLNPRPCIISHKSRSAFFQMQLTTRFYCDGTFPIFVQMLLILKFMSVMFKYFLNFLASHRNFWKKMPLSCTSDAKNGTF